MPGGNGTEAELPKTLQAGTTAVAADVMEDLEKLQAAINGGLGLVNFEAPIAGVVKSSEAISELSESYQDVPGTSRVVKPTVAATLLLVAHFRVRLYNTSSPFVICQHFGKINVDGEDRSDTAFQEYDTADGSARDTDSVMLLDAVDLEPGEHTVKLRSKRNADARAEVQAAQYLYLAIAR